MKLHELAPAPGSKKAPKRVGRGIAGKGGKTAGRGTKGQSARRQIRVGFEGGQTPLHRRTPKAKGFRNPFRVEYTAINLDALNTLEEAQIDPAVLYSHGLVGKGDLVKVLARGEITRAVTVRAHGVSKAAAAAIEAAGGSIEVLPLPWGDRRPPANGNALTNR